MGAKRRNSVWEEKALTSRTESLVLLLSRLADFREEDDFLLTSEFNEVARSAIWVEKPARLQNSLNFELQKFSIFVSFGTVKFLLYSSRSDQGIGATGFCEAKNAEEFSRWRYINIS